jgi:hypothetical protein
MAPPYFSLVILIPPPLYPVPTVNLLRKERTTPWVPWHAETREECQLYVDNYCYLVHLILHLILRHEVSICGYVDVRGECSLVNLARFRVTGRVYIELVCFTFTPLCTALHGALCLVTILLYADII